MAEAYNEEQSLVNLFQHSLAYFIHETPASVWAGASSLKEFRAPIP